jgi:hypothetical protein
MTPASISPATGENVIFPFVDKCFTDNDFILTGVTNRGMKRIKEQLKIILFSTVSQ